MIRSALVALLASLALASPAMAGGGSDHLYGVTTANPPHLVAFESVAPITFTSDSEITGLTPGDTVRGMDTSPRDGGLYLFTENGTVGRLYSLDPTTAVATLVHNLVAGTPPVNFDLTGETAFGMDFNPQSNLIRLTGADNRKNVRVNPANGVVI